MKEDVHNIDDLFRSALEHHEEAPSPAVKENLNVLLDKQDAAAYKRKYTAWKRIAIFFLLLLAGIILYESGILKTGFDHSKENTITNKSGTKKPGTPGMPQQQVTTNKPAHNTTTSTTNKNLHSFNKLTVPASKHDNDFDNSLNNKDRVLKEKATLAVANELISANRTGQQLMNSIHQVPVLNISNAALKNANLKYSKSYWSITGTASYEQVNYKLDSDLPNAINSIKHSEVHEPSFSGGILAARQLKKKWALQTGLIYSHTTIGISPQKLYAFQEPAGSIAFKYITSSGYAFIKPGSSAPPAVGDSMTTAEAEHTLQSLSVPLVIKYSFTKDKFTFRPGVGIEANLLTSAKVEVEIEETPNKEIVFINKLNGAKPFYWSLAVDAELQYRVHKKMFISLRPAFRYALSPITEDNVVETFPYSFGLGIGMTHKF